MKLTFLSAILSVSSSLVSALDAPTPGLMVVYSRPTAADLSEEDFNKWYQTEHIPDIVKCGLSDLVLRYKNVDKKARFQYLALYRLPDSEKVNDPETMSCIPLTSQLLPGKVKGTKGGAYPDIMDMDMINYKRIQTFEGPVPHLGRALAISTAAIEPAAGTEAEFDEWYRKQHLDMFSMLDGYRRTTRFSKDTAPKQLAIHEFTTAVHPMKIGIVLGTEWSRKMLGGAKSTFDAWTFLGEHGNGTKGEAF